MGGKCPHRSVKKRRYSHKTHRRSKFLVKGDDLVYDGLKKAEDQMTPPVLPVDEDLPGMGQYYCLHCDRYFANVTVRDEHFKTKRHRKKVKQLMVAPHTQLDADLAAGMDTDSPNRSLQLPSELASLNPSTASCSRVMTL